MPKHKEKRLIKSIVKALTEKRQHRHRRHKTPRGRRRSSRSTESNTESETSSIHQEYDERMEEPPEIPVTINIDDPEPTEAESTQPTNPYREALDMDVTDPKKYVGEIHTDIKKKFDEILTTGLPKDVRENITKKHTIPGNCMLLDAPQLNPEVKSVITESSKLRDQGIEISQKQVGLAISIIGKTMTDVIQNENVDKHKLLAELADATKILTDVHYHQTRTRIKLIAPLLDKNFNQIMSKTNRDSLLYGENLPELLKNVKQMQQTAAQLKKATPVTSSNRPTNNTARPNQGNRNGPPPRVMKSNRGGPPKTTQPSNYRQPRSRRQPEKSRPQKYRNAQTRR